jgi:rare lipoprotein A
MVIRRILRNWGLHTPTHAFAAAGASSVALAAFMVMFSTRTVQAYVETTHTAPVLQSESPVLGPTPTQLAQQAAIKRGDRLKGLASWYGRAFHGRDTASGEKYNMYAMTACHPTLPFGTLVRVINHATKRAVTVRITDRGDLVDQGRIIDLSYGAAKRLNMTHDGLAAVDLVVLKLGKEEAPAHN